MSVHTKFITFRNAMQAGMIERHAEIDMVLTALLCREHAILVSGPGEAKSMLLDSLMAWANAPKFDLLLNKFTTPEEVAGPISLTGMKSDEYRRVTDGMLPEASLAFLDEIFKASSAILNTTLKILNERRFRNGKDNMVCPLLLCVAASNEWPSPQDGLGALFDRFMFRKTVKPITGEASLRRLCFGSVGVTLTETITLQEINHAIASVDAMQWSPDAEDALLECIKLVRTEGIRLGSRRIRKSVAAAAAYAWLEGAGEVQPDHLEILSHCMWEDPEHEKVAAKVVSGVANPANAVVMSLLSECEQTADAIDFTKIESVTVAIKKLSEIQATLRTTKGSKAPAALQHVTDKIKEIKLRMI